MSSPNPREPAAPLPDLRDETRVEPVPGDPDCYRAEVGPAWAAPVFPSGGMMSAIALRAMQHALGAPEQRLRTATTMFVSTVQQGPVEVRVERLRTGKRMSHLRATLRNAGSREAGHVTTAAFGEARQGFEYTWDEAPEVGPPEQYPLPAQPPPGAPVFRASFFENVETRRIRFFHSFEAGWQGGRAEAMRWLRFRVTPRLPDGRFDPLALLPLADTMPPAIGQYLGPGYPFFHCPSVDLTVQMFADTRTDWLLTRARSRWAGDGYASAEIDLWDADRRLIAHAAQMMLIRFPDPKDLGAA